MKKLCFIDDDDQFEIPLFKNLFDNEFDLVTSINFSDCLSEIKNRDGWIPDLFVLDMYFPSAAPDNNVLEALKTHPLKLPEDQAEIRQAYLNYRAANDRLQAVLDAWKQSADGGIQLAKQVRNQFPNTPVVFYSRKATAEDVLRCMRQDGVFDVISKPTGKTDEDTVQVTMAMKDSLTSRFKMIIEMASSGARLQIKDAVSVVLEEIKYFSGIAD